MLSAIEISGFKSFADKTRMEFISGVSAFVGPNGSGKSNVVDAIKWVLGEQSIKKLRGNEMTDVIFNGSATRQPVQSAEVTLTFDNRQKIFDLETNDVHITRRIYRSGETEYLINRQLSRLKNIRDILSGTGLGTQAYGIIEQGRVESLLQSSSVQRRAIFEEAAGISRFNMKKQEVQRRLERVEQNILRLSDIVSEVETQLNSTKSQAGKAQLYRQYTTRLQELRIHASFIDWRKANRQKEELQTVISELSEKETRLQQKIALEETALHELETVLEEKTQKYSKIHAELVTIRERINKENSGIEIQTTQLEEFETEIGRYSRLLIDLKLKNTNTEENIRQTDAEIRLAENLYKSVSESYQTQVAETAELTQICEEITQKRDRLRKELESEHRQSSRLLGEISGFESRQTELFKTHEQNTKKRELMLQQIRELTEKAAEFQERITLFEQKTTHQREKLEAVKAQKLAHQEEFETLRDSLQDQKQKQSGQAERTAVLQELLKRHEGLSPGVKEILRKPRTPDSPYRYVHGLVADLFRVHVEAASLIEMALGQAAQYVVVSPETEMIRVIERSAGQLPGRVGFLWLESKSAELQWARGPQFDGRTGVHGRADRFVETDPAFSGLALRLLGKTWIVESLAAAKTLYRECDGRTNFLTVSGEYLAADGTLIVGPLHGVSGLISRRSELRTLEEQSQRTIAMIRDMELNQDVLQKRLTEDEQILESVSQDCQQAISELESLRIKRTALTEQLQRMKNQAAVLEEEAAVLDTQQKNLTQEMEKTLLEKEEIDARITQRESELEQVRTETEEQENLRREQNRKLTNTKIELAKSEGRLEFLKDMRKQIMASQKERTDILVENRQRLTVLKQRHDQTSLAILNRESELCRLYYDKEILEQATFAEEKNRAETLVMRTAANTELKRIQQEHNKLHSSLHLKQLEAERLQQESKAIMQRIMDDYKVDITDWEPSQPILAVHHGGGSEAEIPENYQQEIEQLREKIQKLGSVNLEAIEVLESLETRYTTLSNQYNDLFNAKRNIEKIIDRINLDSQRLFEETFEGVKTHFCSIFQKLFGGGHAELILEDPQHPLESGVEIVARPPGKDLKSITLLSGGEKTLTCVALLLALFRFRPSPVCILDEADAALDESNIDRFARVLKEFESLTQFLIITHSKKTMAVANTIYGITMQDSGVSIPISVRFVDVGENGELSLAGNAAKPFNDTVAAGKAA
ncbi:MAG: chromosome segregation protein SMC [Planctomycetaceae bacterium]|jgi:chromosome segregation protein|nr:chromosome segregation protein SMC [Planctomycetaceae bacterium]